MRIFKSEVKEMRQDDEQTPAPERPREVEGRVVDPPRPAQSPSVPAPEQVDRDR
jgi:hypothetical protein